MKLSVRYSYPELGNFDWFSSPKEFEGWATWRWPFFRRGILRGIDLKG
jgi:hypothetical protein